MSLLKINNYELKPFNLQAKEEMKHYLSINNYEISDYTFTANFIWLSSATGFYIIINNTFCLFVLSGEHIHMLLPPLGKNEDVPQAINVCFDIMNYFNKSKYYSKIEYVEENIVENFVNSLESGTLIYEKLADYFIEKKLVDYVYKSVDLIELKGNSYHTKRNEINKFRKSYQDIKTEILSIEKHKEEVVYLFNNWVKERLKYMPKEEMESYLDGIYFERFALKKILENYEDLNLIGMVLYIDNEIKGFTIGEKITENTTSVIIEKTDFETLGSAQYLFREFSKLLLDTYGCEYINAGDDMGFENLKKVKMSYRPDKLIPKHTIYQK